MQTLFGVALFLFFLSLLLIWHYRSENKLLVKTQIRLLEQVNSLQDQLDTQSRSNEKIQMPGGTAWKRARYRLGLEIEAVSEKTGIHASYIERLESGRLKTLEVHILQNLMQFYNNTPRRA